jgi:hypothetical protein
MLELVDKLVDMIEQELTKQEIELTLDHVENIRDMLDYVLSEYETE